jgi:hypothetical protein
MNSILSRHRAASGVAGLAALTALFVSVLWPDTPTWAELLLGGAAALGLYGIIRSPYWSIVYREAPLRRAATGVSDLDERELAVRDRAHGLTYYLFAAFNIVGIALLWMLMRIGHLVIDEHLLQATLFPYAFFAATLPVIMLEWFDPSCLGQAPGDEEDE